MNRFNSIVAELYIHIKIISTKFSTSQP